MRDSQMTKLYKAENEAYPLDSLKKLSNKECTDFVNKIKSSGYYNTQEGFKLVRVTFPKGDNLCAMWDPYDNRLTLPPWAKCKFVILHELSHALCDSIYTDIADHGKEFCTVFLNMVHCYMSKAKAEVLEEVFTKRGVKYARSELNF